MHKPTKSGTSTNDPTIDSFEPNIYFIQSPPCHIPNMKVGLAKKQTRASSGFTIYPAKGFLGPKPSSIQPSFTIIPLDH